MQFVILVDSLKEATNKDRAHLSSQWVDSHQQIVQNFLKTNKESVFKDNVVFVQRSVLSPLLHNFSSNEAELHNLMNKIKQELNGSLIVLECDPIQTHQRLMYRYEVASQEDKDAREQLKETDTEHIQHMITRYDKFAKDTSIVDGVINSTSIKQAVPSLFQALGIQFNFNLIKPN